MSLAVPIGGMAPSDHLWAVERPTPPGRMRAPAEPRPMNGDRRAAETTPGGHR